MEYCKNGMSSKRRPGRTYAATFALISASTFILLLCPCDRPGGSWSAIFLIALSGLFALAAALVLHLDLRRSSDRTAFLSAFEAAGIVALAVYAELRIGVAVIEWMAQIRH